MRKRIEVAMLLGIALWLCLLFSPRAGAQGAPKMEAGVDYNYVHTNAPPGGCGCISMNGGDGWFAYYLTGSFAAASQISAQHASNIGGVGADLTFTSYLFGHGIAGG
jgi:outer membrane immunogenic protein